MRTADVCAGEVEAVDSVSIEKRILNGGIIDPSTPGQRIFVQPNPVRSSIILRGLPLGKRYILRIMNFSGNTIISKSIIGQDHLVIPCFELKSGVYFIALYESNGVKLNGVIRVIKAM